MKGSGRIVEQTIAVVGDDDIARAAGEVLRSAGWSTLAYTTERAVRRALLAESQAFIVGTFLGCAAPAACWDFRTRGYSGPLMALWLPAATDHVEDAWRAGADDFLMLPLRPGELEARLTAVFARGTGWSPIFSAGSLRIDCQRCQADFAAVPLELTRLSYRALAYLVRHRDRIVDFGEFARQVGGHTHPSEPALRQARRWLAEAAKRLGPEASNPIEMVRGVGARLRLDRVSPAPLLCKANPSLELASTPAWLKTAE